MTLSEAKKLRGLIEKAVESLTDEEAVQAKTLYPKWKNGTKYSMGDRICFDGILYKCIITHTSQADWIPGVGTESLYTRIDEVHDGSVEDPVPYNGNMILEAGKYYIQNGKNYLCNRDTINPVYINLSDLVGIYVELA